jgi:hypothetical protein
MQKQLRQAAITAIKEGNIHRLQAIRKMAGQNGDVSVYHQVFGDSQVYMQDGTLVEPEPEEEIKIIPGILPMITSVIVVFPTAEEMQGAIQTKKSINT